MINEKILIKIVILVMAVLSLGSFFYLYLNSYNALPTNGHIWRQVQTLVPTLFMTRDWVYESNVSPWFPQIIPTLGYPWRIIIEFPFYQQLSALFSILFNIDILIISRFICMLSSLFSIFLLYKITKNYNTKFYRAICCTILIGSPLYAYWGSSTILIDQFTILFSLASVYLYFSYKEKNTVIYLILAILLGLISILSKFIIAFYIIFYFVLSNNFFKNRFNFHNLIKDLRLFIPLTIIFLFWVLWMQIYTASSVNANLIISTTSPLSEIGMVGSSSNFFTFLFWERVNKWLFNDYFGFNYGLLIFFNILLINTLFDYSLKKLIYIITTFSYVIINFYLFNNVFFIHNYYQYTNSIILTILILVCLSDKKYIIYINSIIFFAILVNQVLAVNKNLYPTHEIAISTTNNFNPKNYPGGDRIEVGLFLKSINNGYNKVGFLSVGLGYDPTINYFSHMFSIDSRSNAFDSEKYLNTLRSSIADGFDFKYFLDCMPSHSSKTYLLPNYIIKKDQIFSNSHCSIYEISLR